jgi:2-C-methyl-D-erythritol 4-phosphate cytidylyltransferase/2-C-methyl-D-erythritol 2,4-cyclodiphosphate synthase
MDPSKIAAIVPAAGIGKRMGLSVPKQCYELDGKPILAHTLLRISQAESIGSIILVIPPDHKNWAENLVQEYHLAKVTQVIIGGQRRQDSVQAGLEALPDTVELVLVHDGVRPFVPLTTIDNCLQEAEKSGAAMVAVPVKDTLKAVSKEHIIRQTVERNGVWQAQTPQAARVALLKEAYAVAAEKDHFTVTDEASLLENINVPVRVVEGSEKNIKITSPEDLGLAKAILMESQSDQTVQASGNDFRAGYGYDAHRLVKGRSLVLGGVTVDHEKGLEGHSDADVLTHAFCDAILGAAGLGDLGCHFPDTDQQFKDISSLKILEQVTVMVSKNDLLLHNADITVVAEKPKLSPHFATMQKNLAAACGTDPTTINIKATTTEGMGFAGRGEGMGAHAVVLLRKIKS